MEVLRFLNGDKRYSSRYFLLPGLMSDTPAGLFLTGTERAELWTCRGSKSKEKRKYRHKCILPNYLPLTLIISWTNTVLKPQSEVIQYLLLVSGDVWLGWQLETGLEKMVWLSQNLKLLKTAAGFFFSPQTQTKNWHVVPRWTRASAILNRSSRSSAAAGWSSRLGRVTHRWPPACSSTLPSLTTTDTCPFSLAELREERKVNTLGHSNSPVVVSRVWTRLSFSTRSSRDFALDICLQNRQVWELQFAHWTTASNASRLTDCLRLSSVCSVLQTLTTSVTLHTSNKLLMLKSRNPYNITFTYM